ncbi:MAG TPA: prepilin-type N-terminal cleavage/methylation domain-containing protein [Candidatus Saccharimonadales bacterium]|nr:prepilin-type N-terminal cleavage/methylation domain-containing protein [Candidatus Saccharimonadales bacterium]
MTKQKGFTIVEIVVVIAILVVVGLIGWRLWQRSQGQSTNQNSSTSSQVGQSEQTPPISNAADLNNASQTLDNVNVDGGYSSQLDQQTSF